MTSFNDKQLEETYGAKKGQDEKVVLLVPMHCPITAKDELERLPTGRTSIRWRCEKVRYNQLGVINKRPNKRRRGMLRGYMLRIITRKE
jgi:hypothetical protein